MFNPLDLSAAFNTVDHNLLISCLYTNFGIRNKALDGVEFYLNERTQKVTIGDLGTDLGATSKSVMLTFGVLQGSTLGPILFTLYQALLGAISRKHGMVHHLYVTGVCTGMLGELVGSHTKVAIYPTYTIHCKRLWSVPCSIPGSRGCR